MAYQIPDKTPTRQGRVLVADDHFEMRQNVTRLLRLEGFEVFSASNGRLALESIQKDGPFKLVLLDINMPEMDGLTVLENLRAQDKTSRLPVILITGEADANSIARGRALGAQDYLCKPYKIAELMTRIDRCLLACT
ncbi:MAG: evgS 1 [Proteobacteria bacterium]|nr:evgS 1 [Pseudomonadota bacterium]